LNSKILFFLSIIFSLSACGVKGPPKSYPDTIIDSYTREYTHSDPTPEESARMRNKTPIPSALDAQQTANPTPVIKQP
jgi:predicted small lipoprotein YifL